MKVFISWSGPRAFIVAETLNNWLPSVIQAVEPWFSNNITKGADWAEAIRTELEATKVGIFVLDRDHLTSPWLLFEAGAVKKTREALACTLLLNLKPSEVEPPLGLFQHTLPNKDDVLKLLRAINERVRLTSERALTEAALSAQFDMWWEQLNDSFKSAQKRPSGIKVPHRTVDDKLEEILAAVRNLEIRSARRHEPATHRVVVRFLVNNTLLIEEFVNAARSLPGVFLVEKSLGLLDNRITLESRLPIDPLRLMSIAEKIDIPVEVSDDYDGFVS